MRILSRARNIKAAAFLIVLTSCHVATGASAGDDCDGGPECASREKIGLALNGGVLVSAAGTASFMRGFQQQSVTIDGKERPALERFDYIAGLSGGNIPTMLYAFAQNVNADELLDAHYRIGDPSDITRKALNRKHRKTIFRVLTKSVAKRFIPIFLYYFATKQSLKGVWPLVLYYSFLKPFGIKRNQAFGTSPGKHVTNPREEVRAEPFFATSVVGEVQDFGYEFAQTHYDTIGGLNEMGLRNKFTHQSEISAVMKKFNNVTYLPFSISPSEVGPDFSIAIKTDLSGEFLPSKKMKPSEFGRSENTKKRYFSLELALGMATNFATFFVFLGGNATAVADNNKFSQQRTLNEKEMLFSDAGFVYGINVPILVKKEASHIIIPLWPPDAPSKYSTIYSSTKNGTLSDWLNHNQSPGSLVSPFFGFYAGGSSYISHIFDDGEVHMKNLRKAFDDLYIADKPLVTTLKDVKVIDNPYYGIVGGNTVDITILYVSMPKYFAESVPIHAVPPPKGENNSVDETGSFTNKESKDFPHFSQIDLPNFNNTLQSIKTLWNIGLVTPRQVNMMSYLGSWLIKEAWEGVSIGGTEYFGGFKKILES